MDALLTRATARLDALDAAHATWGLGRFADWRFDPDTGALSLTDPDLGTATTAAQLVGTLDDGVWRWSWADREHPAPPEQIGAALMVREHGLDHGLEPLVLPEWPATPETARQMLAVTVALAGLDGGFIGEEGPIAYYFAFERVEIAPPEG